MNCCALRYIALLLTFSVAAASDLSPAEAATHLTETGTVVGIVSQASERNGYVFLNFGKPYPQHTFTAFIPAKMLSAAGGAAFLTSLHGKSVAVTGKIIDYKGKPEIVVTKRDQIEVR